MKNERLRHLSISDNKTFQYNNDVMRQCFNSSSESDYGQYAVRDTGDGCQAWFPKERIWKNGEWVAGSSEVNWKNHIENDGLEIIMELNPGEKPKNTLDSEVKEISHPNPVYTFWKSGNEPYKYIGTYLVDVNSSIPRRQIFRRIDTEIDLSPWYDSINFDYLLSAGNGLNVYKNIYIDGDYSRQKKAVNRFIENYDEHKSGYDFFLNTCKGIYEKYPLSVFRNMNEETIDGFVYDINSAIKAAYGDREKFISIKDLSFSDAAGSFVDLMNPIDHNEAIRNSAFGMSCAGMVAALFNPELYIYSLSEDEADYYINNLHIEVYKYADLVEKHCMLYFWKQCNAEMDNWTAFQFVSFLEYTFGNPYKTQKNSLLSDDCMIKLDYNWLDKSMKWFVNFVVSKQNNSNISFTEGWLKESEGYKYEIYNNAHKTLEYDSWEENMIGSGLILDCVIAAFKSTSDKGFNNLVQFQNVTEFQSKAVDDLKTSEDIIYRLFKDEEPSGAFDDACGFWGRRYPELSYLMFMKDREKYVPVKTTHHITSLKKLKIDTSCMNKCSWDNYMNFVFIHEEIRNRLEQYLGMHISLIDAHSFVWIMQYAEDDLSNRDETVVSSISEDDDPYTSTVISGEKEGRVTYHYVAKYERNAKNREDAIRIHGFQCMACGFNFEKTYGELGKDFIEVHHVKPLFSLTEEIVVNPETDLICLCSNCHRMVHKKRGTVLTLEQLKESIIHKA